MVGAQERKMKRYGTALFFVILLFACGCSPRVDEASLPSVPDVNIAGYQTAVRQQLEGARERFERKPLQAAANGNLAMLYRVYRNFDAAEALFARARTLAPRNADWAYYHGETLEQKAQNAEALAAIEAFLQREPDDVSGRLRAGRLHMLMNNSDEALARLEPLYAEAPQIGDVHVAYAQALTRVGRFDDAVAVWEQALEQHGNFKVGHYALAQLYRRRGDETRAQQQLWLFNTVPVEEPPAYDPRLARLFALNESDRALVLAAQAAKRKGDNVGALELLEQSLERAPANLETRASLVMGYAAESDFASAQRHIEEGLALDPKHVEFALAAARVRLQQGQLQAARAQLAELTQRSPKHADSRAWLARTMELGGANSEAGQTYADAFAIDPQNLATRRLYARWLLANRSPEAAAEVLQTMADTPARDEPVILSALAQVLAKLGRKQDALDALSRGIERAKWQEQSRLVARLENQRASLQLLSP